MVVGGLSGVVLALGFGDGVGDEAVVVAVEGCEGVEDGGFGGVGVDAVAVAFLCAVAVAVVAEVVPVDFLVLAVAA
ncbi:hypothetical protein [Nocardia cyriacigeorgica]|uniref:hypothetical protein n=1 Tax=Nocardia cyriacigeorgica TaxID=135487 RepID=UPI001E2ADF58|nr:hypothetical protein [Nocardia cyriacigeorgica]